MEDIQLYEEIIRLQKGRIPAALAIIVESSGSAPRKSCAKMVVRQDGSILGSVGGGKIEAEVIVGALEAIRQGTSRIMSFLLTEAHGSVCGGAIKVFIEPIIVPPHLVVIGNGHVGQAVARVAGGAGYAVSIINPEELAFEEGGNSAAQSGADGLAALFSTLGVDENTYLFIATRDHKKDFAVAKGALATRARYIGMIGSRRKRAALEKFFAGNGFTNGEVSRIVSPAGLEIGAETPEEIAVSVVGQLIQYRRILHGAERRCDTAGRRAVGQDGPQQTIATVGR